MEFIIVDFIKMDFIMMELISVRRISLRRISLTAGVYQPMGEVYYGRLYQSVINSITSRKSSVTSEHDALYRIL